MKYDTAPVMPALLPQGRLTLTTLVPVLTTAVAAAANVLYTPYVGNLIPIWNGAGFALQIFAELTNVLANSATGSAGPAAAVASKNYDLFVWNNAGVITLTRGGAWNSDTVRSAAAENDLQRVNGVQCNLNTITNGPAAGYGTYVGTVRTDSGGATVSWSFGAAAAGGTPATFNVWNTYNRVSVQATVRDSTATWAYTSATIQSANNSAGNRVSFVRGLNEETVDAAYTCRFSTAAGASSFGSIGMGLDVTNAYNSPTAVLFNVLAAGDEGAQIISTPLITNPPGLGFHFIQACNNGDGVNATTYVGASSMALTAKMTA